MAIGISHHHQQPGQGRQPSPGDHPPAELGRPRDDLQGQRREQRAKKQQQARRPGQGILQAQQGTGGDQGDQCHGRQHQN